MPGDHRRLRGGDADDVVSLGRVRYCDGECLRQDDGVIWLIDGPDGSVISGAVIVMALASFLTDLVGVSLSMT